MIWWILGAFVVFFLICAGFLLYSIFQAMTVEEEND